MLAAAGNLTQANVDAGLLRGDDGGPMSAAVLAELQARLGALQSFVTYANAGATSPLKYLRGIKRVF